MPEVLRYDDLRASFQGISHLLLGNGFSIACDARFNYGSLYEKAVANGLSDRAKEVFAYIGTNNFEAVMRLLFDSHWVAKQYELIEGDESEMLRDLEVIKTTLVEAVAQTHPEHSGSIDLAKKKNAGAFLEPFEKIFSLSYDLLPYWVNLAYQSPPLWEDCFRADPDDQRSPTLVFSQALGDKRGLLYLHGALHFFVETGLVRKHSWCRTDVRLTDSILEGLKKNRYPLFVAEGSADKKLEQIVRNGYLSYCYGKFGRITNRLVVYGFSFGDSDHHIADAIAENTKLRELAVGLYGNPSDPGNHAIVNSVEETMRKRNQIIASFSSRRASNSTLEIKYYQSETARVWG